MSILPQPSMFSWQEVEAGSEISRLARLLDVLPDAELLASLEAGRAGKRNDYPLPALWRALLASIVFGHFIRGKKKMRLRLGLGLLVMLGTALA